MLEKKKEKKLWEKNMIVSDKHCQLDTGIIILKRKVSAIPNSYCSIAFFYNYFFGVVDILDLIYI